MKTIEIIRIREDKQEIINDSITEEIFLTIDIGKAELVTLLCSPGNLKELAVGYLYTSGIINNINEIKDIAIFFIVHDKCCASVNLTVDNIQGKNLSKVQPAGCGKGPMFYDEALESSQKIQTNLQIPALKIQELMKEFQKLSETFLKTGGVHSAAIVKDEKIVVFMEDIGRHNAIDKVIGHLLLNNNEISDFTNCILLTSGRISSEILQKVIRYKIPSIISKSAPTDRAIDICRAMSVTLVGFARGNRMNVYSCPERII
ncbi:MAG: formate dehydrogenase accessory sulfurtransferase FdhD [Bacteroidia bacterium]|nr:formate dehydrogenase accessory sulfurtransferase FdhD [Bacteroidia bacterium]